MSSTPIELDVGVAYRGVELPTVGVNGQSGQDNFRIDLLVIDNENTRGSLSGDARRAMEQLVANYAEPPIRVATLAPSGRPIVMQDGGPTAVQVSASHAGGLIVAACRPSCRNGQGIGVDLVDPASAGRGLDWWSEDTASVSKTNAERALLWAAREAAYKAAMVDVPFSPAKISVELIDDDRFGWRTGSPSGKVSGVGRFFRVDHFLLAVAVEVKWIYSRGIDQEAAPCS